jgi:hypothetical protein
MTFNSTAKHLIGEKFAKIPPLAHQPPNVVR